MMKKYSFFKYKGKTYSMAERDSKVPGFRAERFGIVFISIPIGLTKRNRFLLIHRLIKNKGLKKII